MKVHRIVCKLNPYLLKGWRLGLGKSYRPTFLGKININTCGWVFDTACVYCTVLMDCANKILLYYITVNTEILFKVEKGLVKNSLVWAVESEYALLYLNYSTYFFNSTLADIIHTVGIAVTALTCCCCCILMWVKENTGLMCCKSKEGEGVFSGGSLEHNHVVSTHQIIDVVSSVCTGKWFVMKNTVWLSMAGSLEVEL